MLRVLAAASAAVAALSLTVCAPAAAGERGGLGEAFAVAAHASANSYVRTVRPGSRWVTSAGVRAIPHGRTSFWDQPRPPVSVKSRGSFTTIRSHRPDVVVYRHTLQPVVIVQPGSPAEGGIAYRGVDEGDWSPILGAPVPQDETTYRGGGPKFIDVESERLDRRPIGPDGIDVMSVGGAKIIRIAPGYRRSEHQAAIERPEPMPVSTRAPAPARAPSPSESAPDAVPTPLPAPYRPPVVQKEPSAEMPAETTAGNASEAWLEPWSLEWRERCAELHSSFDPDLGTYRDETGRRRFCTGG
ncbi:hypothetical protein [Consotaella aegiceratis]|uniref:hypothetical protein n=1 Tax=Consotaella aegiceratis TaxID=3097961 RepID=UPI002F3E58F3